MPHSTTVRSIRNRLYLLLLRALLIAVLFLALFSLLTTGFVLAFPSQQNPLYRLPIIARLESYYIARGGWDGVDSVFNNSLAIEASQWRSSLLLDAQNRIVVDKGQPVEVGVTSIYQPSASESVVPINVNGVTVGKLVLPTNYTSAERRFTFGFIQPVLAATIFLIFFATLIGLLLTRRVVVPLAEVIATAEEIAAGNLQRRVSVQGPDDLRVLSDSFNQMAESLERNDRERRDMLADIAHELRTPLTVMRGRLEGIMDGIYPADQSHIGPALEETYLLERLVEDLRLLTLAESHQLVFEKCESDLVEISHRSISMFQAEVDEKNIHLDLLTSLEKASAIVDPLRTEQVISNLISNALRYVPQGGHVWIEITRQDNEFILSVNDNGPGVPEKDLPFIFNRFWRGEKSRSRVSGGAGLGLAIAKFLVEGQDGHIAARSLPGSSGLQISISFPIAG
jgi:signal transduction histidine kinase